VTAPQCNDSPARQQDADRRLEQFEEAWLGGTAPRLEDYLLPGLDSTIRLEFLTELIKIDLDRRWRQEVPALQRRVEDYLGRWPELARPAPRLLDLIREEYWSRCCWNKKPGHAEYLTRFPQHQAELTRLLLVVDGELAAERCSISLRREHSPVPPLRQAAPPAPTVAGLMDLLRSCQLLNPGQFDEITSKAPALPPGPMPLVKELMRREWLTPYQANQLLPGHVNDLVLGPYVLLERLGAGGMGQVFKARDRVANRLVALKVIRREFLGDAEGVGRFRREIQLVSQLDHPNVVRALDGGASGDTLFLAMEFVEGSDLGKLVKQSGPLPVMQACEYVRQAALGLQHVHERGLVHRDIKPHNLLMSVREGVVKLADLGLARLHRAFDGEVTSALTGAQVASGTLTPQNAILMGTADFLAPEQALDFHNADIRADIYSLGCTLYFLLTGRAPFADGNLAQKVANHLQAEPPRLEKVCPDAPPALAESLRKMMAKRPADRFQTPADVARELQAILAGHRGTAGSRWGRFRRRGWLVGAAACLLGAGVLLWAPRTPAPAPPAQGAGPELHALQQRASLPFGSNDALWHDLLHFRTRYAGTPEAMQAADLFRQLRSPLDALDGKTIPPGERFWHQPKELVGVLGEHRWCSWRAVRCAAGSHDGKKLAAAGDDGFVRIWDIKNRKILLTFPAHAAEIRSIAYSPDDHLLATGSKDGTLKLWDTERGQLRQELAAHEGGIRAVVFAPKGRLLLASAGDDDTPRLWPFDEQLIVREKQAIPLKGHKGPVHALAFHPDGKVLASGGEDRRVKLWEVDGARALPDLGEHAGAVNALAFAGSDCLISGGTSDGPKGELKFWDLKAKTALTKPTRTAVRALAVSPDGKTVAVPTSNPTLDGEMRFFDIAKRDEKESALPRNPVTTALLYLPEGKSIALFEGPRFAIYSLDTRQAYTYTDDRDIERAAVAFSPDCKLIATGGGTPIIADQRPAAVELKLWDVATLKEVHAFKGHGKQIQDLAFAPDGSALAAADIDGCVKVWDLATRKERFTVRIYAAGNESRVYTIRIAYSPNGKVLAAGEYRGSNKPGLLTCWNSETGAPVHTFPGHALGIKAVAFSPDGSTLVSGGSHYDRTVKLWDMATLKERTGPVPVLDGGVSVLNYSPDGQSLALSNLSSTTLLWDVAKKAERARFKTGAHAAAFLHGKFVTTVNPGGAVNLWNEVSRTIMESLSLFGPARAANLASNGRHLAVANGNGTIYILDLKDFALRK